MSAVILASAACGAGACEGLSSLKLENATVTSAQIVAEGAFGLPNGRAGKSQGPNPYQSLPPFSGWNNKHLAVDKGGWAGTTSWADLADGLSRGYATSGNDSLTDARSPDIKPFLAHTGKLLLYHAWSDQLVPTDTTIGYYEEVAKSRERRSSLPLELV